MSAVLGFLLLLAFVAMIIVAVPVLLAPLVLIVAYVTRTREADVERSDVEEQVTVASTGRPRSRRLVKVAKAA
ncbi:hypothetical protein ACTQ49_02775 [Luteococcus sp. Sow4_B9]|uniref:hypothetical protein n=1 Tax=Luteococcus sp. Sow4_B9 TaxID=3438792 RepID=UPI003F9A918D